MKVFIVRHGETDWNLEHRWQGITDIPLNNTGKEQAQKIANRLRLEKIDAILTSPLIRAKDTAKAIALYHPNAPLIIEEALQELKFGIAEGMTWEEFSNQHPQLVFSQMTAQERFTSKFPGGESMEERVEQLIPKVNSWKEQYKDKTIVISTHGLAKKCLLIAFNVLAHEDSDELRFQNTALTIINPFDTDKIELLNDVSHLEHES